MVHILLFLAHHCAFLFRPGYFRFVDSRVDESFGGDAYVVLESDALRLRFVSDRAQLAGEFQPVDGRNGPWYTLDLLRGLLHGDRSGPYELDATWARFLAESLPEVEGRFASPESRALR